MPCHVVVEKQRGNNRSIDINPNVTPDKEDKENENPTTLASVLPTEWTYEKITKEAAGCQWTKDLRQLPQFTFVNCTII